MTAPPQDAHAEHEHALKKNRHADCNTPLEDSASSGRQVGGLSQSPDIVRDEDGGVPPSTLTTDIDSPHTSASIRTHDPPEQQPLQDEQKEKEAPVRWRDLPHKQQLLIIVLTRLSEPLVQTSIQSYMFYQLKWFDPSLPDAVVAGQAGVLHASFTAAQLLTALLWGRVADSRRAGRKTVVLIGLAGTAASCVGFGLSTSFPQALLFRALGGATNGNVGVLRTMISELMGGDKKYQQRAFVLLPMTFNVGVIVGPVLGGLLADPAGSYPGSAFGQVAFFRRFPYAAPNLVSAFFLCAAATAAWLFLEEVSRPIMYLALVTAVK